MTLKSIQLGEDIFTLEDFTGEQTLGKSELYTQSK